MNSREMNLNYFSKFSWTLIQSSEIIIISDLESAFKVTSSRDVFGSLIEYKSNRNWRPLVGERAEWIRHSIISGVIIGIILATLGFDFLTNSGHSTSPFSIIFNSISQLYNKNNATSLGILALVVTSWTVGILIFSSQNDQKQDLHEWLESLAVIAVASFYCWFFYTGYYFNCRNNLLKTTYSFLQRSNQKSSKI
jgi:uncharacterized membrane protein